MYFNTMKINQHFMLNLPFLGKTWDSLYKSGEGLSFFVRKVTYIVYWLVRGHECFRLSCAACVEESFCRGFLKEHWGVELSYPRGGLGSWSREHDDGFSSQWFPYWGESLRWMDDLKESVGSLRCFSDDPNDSVDVFDLAALEGQECVDGAHLSLYLRCRQDGCGSLESFPVDVTYFLPIDYYMFSWIIAYNWDSFSSLSLRCWLIHQRSQKLY